MATFLIPITCSDITGSTNFKVLYRHAGTIPWTSYLIPAASGTTTSFTGVDNWIYDIQVQNINGVDNPLSVISQSMGITAPAPTISPSTVEVDYSFENLSEDLVTYTVTIAPASAPGSIIATHVLPAGTYPNTIVDTFTGLTPYTSYILSITPGANQFTNTFTYTFNTAESVACAAPSEATATLS
jgi:hypothetical protein